LPVEGAGGHRAALLYETFGLHGKPLNHEEMAADFGRG
jgi:hypothetical protein